MKSYQSIYLDSPLIKDRCLDIFEPDNPSCDIALFFVHGGGWSGGTHTFCHALMEAFNDRGIICATTGYRLSAVTALDQLTDIRESYDFFVNYLKERQRPPKVAVFGSSAGAHLASLLLCTKPGECGDRPKLKMPYLPPVCGILQSTPTQFTPWDDIFPHIWGSMQNIAGVSYQENPGRYEALSLCRYIRKDNPKLFFAEAQNEHMFPPEMTYSLMQKHNAMGIASQWKMYKNVEHGFFYDLSRWQQRLLFEDIIHFICGETVPVSAEEQGRGELFLKMTHC
ncbi:MAG: alpha/beta hydrolase [Victivallales bacterium]|jgi:acetyl esterase/lipase|nr:alpha/beta hydrolase [Victivallales bacterium]